ncbi:MAG: radical SAM protein [Candidatus Omnitrophota bacterium]|jgi:anaerobic magnesium-protoporphyrin IX monomethyl ester cyclase
MILINTSSKDALKIFQPFLPVSVPIGIGCLAAFALREKINVKIIDEQVEDNVLELVSEYVKDLPHPYIFGFSVLTAGYKSAILLSEKLKRIYPDSVIVFGGIHSSACPDDILSYRHIDAVIRGEGEKALVEFYRCVKEGKEFTHLDGLSYRKNGVITHNKIALEAVSLNEMPAFPYYLFKSKRYDLSFVVGSRGCPYRCIFCSNRVTTGKKYRYASTKSIIQDLGWVYNQYLAKNPGKGNVQFLDDNLLVNKERIYELIDQIKIQGFDKKMTFSFQARGDNVNYKLLQDLYEAGFKSVFFGLETASERIMKIIKKDETVAKCVEAVKMAKQIGFYVSATFIYGLPGDSHKDRIDCLRLSKELKLDMVRYNNATPYPGTELYEIAKSENRIRIEGLFENFISVSTFIESPFRPIPFSYVPAGSSENEIRNDLLYSYFVFYLDFNKLKQIFTDPNKGAGWFNAGETTINLIKKFPALLLLGVNISIKFYKLLLSMLIDKIVIKFRPREGMINAR